MQRFEPVALDYKPDWVTVPEDVNSPAVEALTVHTPLTPSTNPKQKV